MVVVVSWFSIPRPAFGVLREGLSVFAVAGRMGVTPSWVVLLMPVIPLLGLAGGLSVDSTAFERPVLKVPSAGLTVFAVAWQTSDAGSCAVLLLPAKMFLGLVEALVEAKAEFEEAEGVWRWTLRENVTILEPSMMLKEGVLVSAGLPVLNSAVSGTGGGVWVGFGVILCGTGLGER